MRAGDWLRAWAALAGQSIVLLFYCCTCVFALYLVPMQAARIVADALERTSDTRTPLSATRGAGLLVVAQALATIVAALVAAAIGARLGPEGSVIACVLASIALNAAWAPLALAPFAHVEGEGGVVPAIVRSFELSARRGWWCTLRLGIEVGTIASAIPITIQMLSLRERGALGDPADLRIGWFALVAAIAAVVAVPSVLALRLALAYRDAKGRAAFDRARDPRVRASVRRIAMLIVPGGAGLGLALGLAALIPTPMHLSPQTLEPVEAIGRTTYVGSRVAIPGDHGLVVFNRDLGISIETADGGGAGFVELPDEARTSWDDGVEVWRARFRGAPAWAAISGRRVTYFDDEGVRLEDGIVDRLGVRVGRQSLAFVALALVLSLALARVLLRAMRDAAALDAPRWEREARPPARGALARIEGKLRLSEGARIALGGARAVVSGPAHVEVAGAMITLPPELRALALDEPRLEDGAPLTLVVPAEPLAALGPRQGAIPLPDGALLVPEERDLAAERLLSRAARGAALLALGAAGSLGVAAFTIFAAC